MTVVILDTNALPHGHFNDRVLRNLLDVAGPGASIVVPEVVVWEWAEHAHLAQASLAETIRQHKVDDAVIKRLPLPQIPEIESLVESVKSALGHRATIWAPPAEAWRDALRHQILQTGTGERKVGVKTGAADAIVLACVEHYVDATDAAVVLMSSDGELRKACKKVDERVLVANGVGQLLPQLNTFEPAAEDLILSMEEQLPILLNEAIVDEGEALAFGDLGVEFISSTMRLAVDTSPRLSGVRIAHVDTTEVHDFSITRVGSTRYGLAELRIFGDISIVVVEQQELAPGQYAPAPQRVSMAGAHIDVTVAIRWNHNWQFDGIEPTGVAVVVADADLLGDEPLSEYEVPPFHARALITPGDRE